MTIIVNMRSTDHQFQGERREREVREQKQKSSSLFLMKISLHGNIIT